MNARVGMILIAAIFVLSPVLAWLTHQGFFDFSSAPGEGKNNGDLIHPARPLENFKLEGEDGGDVDINSFLGQWSMVQFADSPCVEDCLKNIYKMRQVRLAAGKDAHRIQRVVISEQGTDLAKLMEDNPGTRSFVITSESTSLLEQFPGYTEGNISPISSRIYIVDPLGNLMMQYPHEANPSAVLKDLRQLLKATWIRPRQ